ncbi:MAG: hypothetical protein P4L84_16010 [Isosphaeraceae bacterium]|nr:hypothetical protein [Isosphaeraceae bacterium]
MHIAPPMPPDANPHWAHWAIGKSGVLKLWEVMATDQFWKGAVTAAVLLLVCNAVAEKVRSHRES